MGTHLFLLLVLLFEVAFSTPDGLELWTEPFNDNINEAGHYVVQESIPRITTVTYVKMTINGQIVQKPDCTTGSGILVAISGDFITPKIVTARKLDYDNQQLYNMTLTCRDPHTDRTGSVNVIVQVIPDNRHSPWIALYHNIPGLLYHDGDPAVNENVDIGTLVALVAAKDPLDGDYCSGGVSCRLDNGSPFFRMLEVSPGEYNISTKVEMDHERRRNYELTILCYDIGANRQLVSSLEFTVHVLDENDNPPRMMINTFTETGNVILTESPPSNSATVFMAVTDADGDEVDCYYHEHYSVIIQLP